MTHRRFSLAPPLPRPPRAVPPRPATPPARIGRLGPAPEPLRSRSHKALIALAFALAAVFAVAGTGLAATAGTHAGALSATELARVHGGTCGTCRDDGGSTTNPYAVESYWVEVRRDEIFRDIPPWNLEAQATNSTSRDMKTTFSFERRTVRRVEFSGGYANWFRGSVGGEIDKKETISLEAIAPPRTTLSLLTRYEQRRYRTYGRQYTVYSDGSRKTTGSSDGPYFTGHTHYKLHERSF